MCGGEDYISAESPPQQRVAQILRRPKREENEDGCAGYRRNQRRFGTKGESEQTGLRHENKREKKTGPLPELRITEERKTPGQGREAERDRGARRPVCGRN